MLYTVVTFFRNVQEKERLAFFLSLPLSLQKYDSYLCLQDSEVEEE